MGAAPGEDGGALKSGVYGLFRLDGGPIDRGDAQSLGLTVVGDPGAALAHSIDPHAPHAISRAEDTQGLTILLGELEETQALAARFSLPSSAPPAVLARAALRRFGAETPSEMIGEWSLLHWDPAGRLVLMMSAARRDPLLFAVDGPRVAVAPDLFRLARVPWIGTAVDEAGLLFSLARTDLRAARGERTMLARVRQLETGACVTIDRHACRNQVACTLAPQPRWNGSFDDALDEAELVMRRVARSRFGRTAAPAVLLSGGLDSSLLAWLAAEERGADQAILLFTSARAPRQRHSRRNQLRRCGRRTPRGADAARGAAAAGGHLSAVRRNPERHDRAPAAEPALPDAGLPDDRARNRGGLLVNGGVRRDHADRPFTTGDGASPAAPVREPALSAPENALADIAGANPFHVRLAPGRHAALPEATRAALRAPPPATGSRADGLWGYQPGIDKALQRANELHAGAVRMDYPYRDLRLLRLFAGFPADLLPPRALDRGLARTMLAGRVPDAVRLRTSGMPAEPDHNARLQRQAPAARARIAAFRRAEVGEWLDLDWLDGALAEIGERGPTSASEANEAQLTAIAAEFLTWWRARS